MPRLSAQLYFSDFLFSIQKTVLICIFDIFFFCDQSVLLHHKAFPNTTTDFPANLRASQFKCHPQLFLLHFWNKDIPAVTLFPFSSSNSFSGFFIHQNTFQNIGFIWQQILISYLIYDFLLFPFASPFFVSLGSRPTLFVPISGNKCFVLICFRVFMLCYALTVCFDFFHTQLSFFRTAHRR